VVEHFHLLFYKDIFLAQEFSSKQNWFMQFALFTSASVYFEYIFKIGASDDDDATKYK